MPMNLIIYLHYILIIQLNNELLIVISNYVCNLFVFILVIFFIYFQACVLYILRVGVADQMTEPTQRIFLVLLGKKVFFFLECLFPVWYDKPRLITFFPLLMTLLYCPLLCSLGLLIIAHQLELLFCASCHIFWQLWVKYEINYHVVHIWFVLSPPHWYALLQTSYESKFILKFC